MRSLRPFWCYYGGKWRAAPTYPKPLYPSIVEPFAGAAGYSLRYPDLAITLVERYPIIAEVWRYLIKVNAAEILRIPCVEHVDDLPAWVPQAARWLVGFNLNNASVRPCNQLSAGKRKLRDTGLSKMQGWCLPIRARIAAQVERIRHWRIIEGEYTDSPRMRPRSRATWFVDPPYANGKGAHYVYGAVDHAAIGAWCRALPGQVIVCENAGATWLPFRPFATKKTAMTGRISHEVIWTCER